MSRAIALLALLALAAPRLEAQPSRARQDSPVYRNAFLGYSLTRPAKDWIWKKSPPEPLTDVLAYQAKTEAELGVMVLSDPAPEATLSEATLPQFQAAIAKKLQERFNEVKPVSSAAFTFKDLPALKAAFTGTSKSSQKGHAFRTVTFKTKGKLYSIFQTAPAATWDSAAAALDRITDSFAFVEAQELEGDVFTHFEYLYSVKRPAGWEIKKEGDTTRILAPGGAAFVSVTVTRLHDKKPMAELAKAREAELQAKGFQRVSSRPVNVIETIGHELVYAHDPGTGARETRELLVWIDRKLYRLAATVSPDQKEAHAAGLKEALASFAVQRDSTSKASIEEGFKAIELFDQADRHFHAQQWAQALPLYKEALSYFPRFAGALNNQGLAQFRLKETSAGLASIKRAFDLYPENVLLRRNLAYALNERAGELAGKGDHAGAIREMESALTMDRTNADLVKNLAILHNNYGIAKLNQKNFGSAVTSFQRACQLDRTNAEFKQNLATAHYNQAVEYVNKNWLREAVRPLEECLKVAPNHAEARALLQQIRERLK